MTEVPAAEPEEFLFSQGEANELLKHIAKGLCDNIPLEFFIKVYEDQVSFDEVEVYGRSAEEVVRDIFGDEHNEEFVKLFREPARKRFLDIF